MTNKIKVGITLKSAEALKLWREAHNSPKGWPPPIPAGYNTFLLRFTTADNQPAILIQQTGFDRILGEDDVNGLSAIVCLDGALSPDQGFACMESFIDSLL